MQPVPRSRSTLTRISAGRFGGSPGFKPSETVAQVFHHHLTGNNPAGSKVGLALRKGLKPSGRCRSMMRCIIHARTIGARLAAFQSNFSCGSTGRVRRDFNAIADDVLRQFGRSPPGRGEIIRRQRDRPNEKTAQDMVVGEIGEDTAGPPSIREIADHDGNVIVTDLSCLSSGTGAEKDQSFHSRNCLHHGALVAGEP